MRETLGIVDCAYILNQGKLLVKGQPEEILENDEARKVYLGKSLGCKKGVYGKTKIISAIKTDTRDNDNASVTAGDKNVDADPP